MKAKLCVFVLMLAFSGLVHAEYYLVYPMTDSTCCYNKHRYHECDEHSDKWRQYNKFNDIENYFLVDNTKTMGMRYGGACKTTY